MSKQVSFVERSSPSQRVPYRRFHYIAINQHYHIKPTEPSPAVSKYAEGLRNIYANYQGSIPDKLPYTLGMEYVTLTLVKNEIDTHKKAQKFIRHKAGGTSDLVLNEIKVKDILKPEENIRLVVIEGDPGIGKSTLSVELCHQWQTYSLLEQFSLVILLKFRDETLKTASSVDDLFPVCDDKENRDKVVKEVKINNGKGVIFIFDGFDEFPAKLQDQSLVMDLINKPDNLSKATIIVTTRPSASGMLRQALKTVNSKHIEIIGFTKEAARNASSKAFNDPKVFSEFSKYLSATPVVEMIMHNPLHCAIIVYVYNENFQTGRPIPHTLTELYTELSRELIRSDLNTKGDARELPDALKDFPEDLYIQLLTIGELAYNGTVTGNREIFGRLPEGTNGLGLLIEHRPLFSGNKTVSYNFLHKSLQEYMSAFYISQTLEVDKQNQLIRKTRMLRTFLAGLTKMNNIGWDNWAESERPRDIYHLHNILCFYEAHTVENCVIAFGRGAGVIDLSRFGALGDYDMHALGYAINLCEKLWSLNLEHATVSGIEMLSHGLKYHKGERVKGSIKKLSLHRSDGIMNYGEHLIQMPHPILHNIKVLDLTYCNISHEGFQNLATCVPKLKSLRTLVISGNPGGPGSLVGLMEALKAHRKLFHLDMQELDFGLEDISALSAMIKSSKSLFRLTIGGGSNSTPEIDRDLVKTVLLPSSLKFVAIFLILDYNFSILESVEVVSSKLKTLILCDVSALTTKTAGFSTGKGTRFGTILGENTSLKNLLLLFYLHPLQLETVLCGLEENDTLERLELYNYMKSLISGSQMQLDPRIVFGNRRVPLPYMTTLPNTEGLENYVFLHSFLTLG